jgi:hypothetical protein
MSKEEVVNEAVEQYRKGYTNLKNIFQEIYDKAYDEAARETNPPW